jgi:hypothetical protein
LCWVDLIFVSGAQTPSPLIRPAGPILGVPVRGKRKTRPVMTGRFMYLGEPHSEALDPVRDGGSSLNWF